MKLVGRCSCSQPEFLILRRYLLTIIFARFPRGSLTFVQISNRYFIQRTLRLPFISSVYIIAIVFKFMQTPARLLPWLKRAKAEKIAPSIHFPAISLVSRIPTHHFLRRPVSSNVFSLLYSNQKMDLLPKGKENLNCRIRNKRSFGQISPCLYVFYSGSAVMSEHEVFCHILGALCVAHFL